MTDLNLLLAYTDDHAPVLERGLAAREDEGAPAKADHLIVDGRDKNLLDEQGWGIVAPAGPDGDRLLALVEGLRKHRSEETDLVRVYRVPSVMSERDIRRFRDDDYLGGGKELAPLYLLLLGDLHQVPFELQQAMMAQSLVGRLAFSDDAGYEAYTQKLLDAERAPAAAPNARALYFNARDGTAATTIGYEAVMKPTVARARARLAQGKLPATEVLEIEEGDDAGAALLAEAGKPDPAALFSISHGLGRPRRGWKSHDEQRALQGAMSLGLGARLTASDVAHTPFLPGGVWFYVACYGAGTPGFGKSAYHRWLEELGHPEAKAVLAGLPREGEAPFIAALPKAALANPRGPLAVMGHVDLAWTYGFQDVGQDAKSRAARFQDFTRALVEGDRAGIAASTLWSTFVDASVSVSMAISMGGAGAQATAIRADRANLWMLRNDVGAYILLGDPAAQLPIAGRRGKKAGTAAATVAALFPGMEVRSAMPAAGGVKTLDLETMEKAVLPLLNEDVTAKKAAETYGVEKADVEAWAEAYREAGRAALERLRAR
jgi:hypothetical protein